MNLRHILRTNIRLNLDVSQASCESLNGDLEKSLVFAAITAANVGQLDDDPVLTRQYAHTNVPDDLRRPIRAQRVAESLGLPRETTRVKVKLLIEEGLLQSTRSGLLIASASMTAPRFQPLMRRYLESLGQAIEQLAITESAGLSRQERLHPLPFPAMWGCIRLTTQHVLRGTVDLRSYTAPLSLLGSYLYLAMADVTSSHFSEGPEIVFADHDTPPPSAARRTISASALATKLAMPRETVRRNLKAMVSGGWLYQDSSGFGLPTAETKEARERERQMQERSSSDLSRLVRKLRHIGAIVSDGSATVDHSPAA
jgi:hypothetical protein